MVNDGFQPLSVVLEPRSFTITEDGDGVFGPLSKDIRLKLSAMSFRIPPLQSRFVFYEASADTLPAWFVIYSEFSSRPHDTGVSLQVDLPHTVYLLQKQPLERPDVTVQSSVYLPTEHRVVITIANRSPRLGRVLEWQVSSKRAKTSGDGFPLLPQSQRRLEVEWNSPDPPNLLSIRFQHFTLKEDLGVHRE